MDRIYVDGIELHGYHGVSDEERTLGHRYRVDLALELDLRPAGASDDVTLTVDYAEAARVVLEIGTGSSVHLVETLAERMADALLSRFSVLDAVGVKVAKIHPPVAIPFRSCAVEIRRVRG
jgi:7,8-dihydroneopterin aldolase/epimerase/oxygenase